MNGLSLAHELNLVREIMTTIERLNKDDTISPAPASSGTLRWWLLGPCTEKPSGLRIKTMIQRDYRRHLLK
jgi:hypothetical protein